MDTVNAALALISQYTCLSAGAFFTIVALAIGILYFALAAPTVKTETAQAEQRDEHAGPVDQELQGMSGDMESSHPMDLSRPREAFSRVMRTTESGFLSGATLQYSPGGHGLAFPTWITPPLSFAVPVDYDIKDVRATEDFVDNGPDHARSIVVMDVHGIRWPVLEADLPNLQAFLEEMRKDANAVIYGFIDRLRHEHALARLQAMKAKLGASFKDTPLALWIDLHVAHVLLRAALMDLKMAPTMLKESLATFNQCLDGGMRYKDRGPYLNRLYCSAYLGRAWYYVITGHLEKARQDLHRAEEFEWSEEDAQYKLSATIHINWAKAAVCLSAGDLHGADKSMHEIGWEVELRRGAVNEAQRVPLDIHVERNKGNLYTALHVCARCLLSHEEPVQFDPITEQASERAQQICMGVIGDLWFALGACHEAYKMQSNVRKTKR